MVKLHPASIKLRHLVAPAFVVSIVLLSLAGIFVPLAWLALASELWLYFLLAVYFGYKVARRNGQGLRMALLMLVVFLTIHISWGTSFLLGLLRGTRRTAESQLGRSSSQINSKGHG
jgi:hypothetical protein